MTGRLSKLKQDLTDIETITADLSQKAPERYQIYLDLLSDSAYKQAIMAVYQLCTRSYPREFLALSHSQRQKLQEDIKAICQETRTSLSQLGEIKIDRVTYASLESSSKTSGSIDQQNILKVLLDSQKSAQSAIPLNHPDTLFHWCQAIEKSITDILSHLSKKINHQLQQAYILPSRLPSQILDLAIQAEDEGQQMSGGHNLLNVLIESENQGKHEDDDDDDNNEEPLFAAPITKITAIHLRLAEIEFADARLTAERHQIRSLWEHLNRIREQYHRTHKEYTIAQAESAWRGSWYE